MTNTSPKRFQYENSDNFPLHFLRLLLYADLYTVRHTLFAVCHFKIRMPNFEEYDSKKTLHIPSPNPRIFLVFPVKLDSVYYVASDKGQRKEHSDVVALQYSLFKSCVGWLSMST